MSEHKLKASVAATRNAYAGDEKARVEAEAAQSMQALTRAFLAQIKTPDMVPIAMEHLCMMHFTILLHRFEPKFWERLMVTYNENMWSKFEEVEAFVEEERKNERKAESQVPKGQ